MIIKCDADLKDSTGNGDAAYNLCGEWDALDGFLDSFKETMSSEKWLDNAEGDVTLTLRISRVCMALNLEK